jgi:hypothetical protein
MIVDWRRAMHNKAIANAINHVNSLRSPGSRSSGRMSRVSSILGAAVACSFASQSIIINIVSIIIIFFFFFTLHQQLINRVKKTKNGIHY